MSSSALLMTIMIINNHEMCSIMVTNIGGTSSNWTTLSRAHGFEYDIILLLKWEYLLLLQVEISNNNKLHRLIYIGLLVKLLIMLRAKGNGILILSSLHVNRWTTDLNSQRV